MGDGEIEEGQIWEAGMAAAKYGLDNLCGVIDVNGCRSTAPPPTSCPPSRL